MYLEKINGPADVKALSEKRCNIAAPSAPSWRKKCAPR